MLPENLKEKVVYFFSMMITKLINRNKDIGSYEFKNIITEAYSSFRKKRPEVAPDETFFERQTAPGIGIDLSLAVTGALDRLSPEQREAVVLKVYQGFKFDEMAEILECPVSTVKSRLYTALELLKATLAPVTEGRA